MVLGLKFGGPSQVKENNGVTYKKVQEFISLFVKEKGTLVCKDLLKNAVLQSASGNDLNLRERCCAGLVALSCELLETMLAAGAAV
jgi:hypothetical protein